MDSLTGKDVVQVDDRVLSDLADGECVTVVPEEEIAAMKIGKNDNILFAENRQGRKLKVTLRVMIGSPDDKYLNSRLQEQEVDFSNFKVLSGAFSKRVGDGTGKQSTVVYSSRGGIFQKVPSAKSNSDADTEQSVSVYEIMFGSHVRSVQ